MIRSEWNLPPGVTSKMIEDHQLDPFDEMEEAFLKELTSEEGTTYPEYGEPFYTLLVKGMEWAFDKGEDYQFRVGKSNENFFQVYLESHYPNLYAWYQEILKIRDSVDYQGYGPKKF